MQQVMKRQYDREKALTPVSLTGVLIPWSKKLGKRRSSDYKLVSSSGLECFILADSEWRGILSWYSWEEVQVVGLLNVFNMTVIPQKIFPKGPIEKKENVIDLAKWKARKLTKKFIKNMNDLVLIPAAICALMIF